MQRDKAVCKLYLLGRRAAKIERAESEVNALARRGHEREQALAHVALLVVEERRRERAVARSLAAAHERPVAFCSEISKK